MSAEVPALFTPSIRLSRQLSRQEYDRPKEEPSVIEGVRVVELRKFFKVEDGLFGEVFRLDDGRLVDQLGEEFPDFQVRQVNYSETIPSQIKAWHLHERQDEIWIIPPTTRMIVGILDMRQESPTRYTRMRLVKFNDKAWVIYLPRGVAHGLSTPYPETARMIYLVNNYFDGTDEWRLPYNHIIGREFWRLARG